MKIKESIISGEWHDDSNAPENMGFGNTPISKQFDRLSELVRSSFAPNDSVDSSDERTGAGYEEKNHNED